MNIHFILVEPSLLQNIGACTRALKTMDFTNLRLVNPCNHLDDLAKWVAVGSAEILEKALVYSSCKAAIQDCDFAIRTAVRKRSSKFRHYSCKDTLTYLNKRSRIFSNVAVIFGRENNGLTNQEINFCNIISYIPIKTIYPSLNLAQAVMVYAYSFASFLINEGSPKIAKADESTIRKPKNRIAELLPKIGVEPSTKIYFQILVRIAALNADDLKLLYYVLKKLENSFLAQRRIEH